VSFEQIDECAGRADAIAGDVYGRSESGSEAEDLAEAMQILAAGLRAVLPVLEGLAGPVAELRKAFADIAQLRMDVTALETQVESLGMAVGELQMGDEP